MAVQTQIQTRRGTAASWTSTNPTLAAGEIGFETDTGKFKIGNGSTAWAALAYSAGATAVTYLFNATSGQTTFSGADANGLTLAYTVGAEQVYLNGVLQVRGSDYTATNGTSIVLTSGALTSDVLNVIAYSAMTVTDTYTQAQADAKFFQTANAFLAGKNKIINGDFGVWQRGTSFTSVNGNFSADRFFSATNKTVTVSQQTFTAGTAPVAGYEGTYFLRMAQSASGSYYALAQKVEDVRVFAGQTVTLSFWAKANATVANRAGMIQNFGSGGSANVDNYSSSFNITTSWARYTYTVTLASISGKTIGTGSNLTVQPILTENATAHDIDIWGVQLEAGSIATPFQTATGTIAGELAACQRYYWRRTASTNYDNLATGVSTSATASWYSLTFPVEMRTAPSAIEFSTLQIAVPGNTAYNVTAAAFDGKNAKGTGLAITTASGGLGSATSNVLYGQTSGTSYLAFTAEL